jgi:hypothetical protein
MSKQDKIQNAFVKRLDFNQTIRLMQYIKEQKEKELKA